MKTTLIIIGAIVAFCCVGGIVFGLFAWRTGTGVMAEAQQFGDETLAAVGKNWDAEELWRRGTAEFHEQVPRSEVEALMRTLSGAVGPYRSIESRVTGINYQSNTADGTYLRTEYSGLAQFEKGTATVEMTLLRRGERWGVLKFNVSGDLIKQYQEQGTEEGALQFGDETIRAIASQWSLRELERRAAPELIEQNTEGQLATVVNTLGGALGPLKQIVDREIVSFGSEKAPDGTRYTKAVYDMNGDFRDGTGSMQLVLIERGNGWELLAISGESHR
jgi:hypothetical protein